MSDDVLTRCAPPPHGTAAYGPLPEQVIDFWRAAQGPAPLAVVIHGGFWRARYDRMHARPMANALAAAGFAVAVPEYRRVGSPGGGWSGTFDDLAAALDAVPQHAARYGGDPERAVWIGHSAGGHLALWSAARHRLPADSPWHTGRAPAPVVALAGCCCLDLSAAWGEGGGAAAALLGGTPDRVPERYALADPSALLPLGTPVTLVHGTLDESVRPEMSRRYAQRAGAAGDPVRLVELDGVGHMDLIDPLAAPWPRVVEAIRAHTA
jgi:acetyl esterase/lipase